MAGSETSLPVRIAFGGRMQVGKTTAADYLVSHYAFKKYALADPIKRIAVERFGWDGEKDRRGRRLLQEIGTVGRNYDPVLWLDRLSAILAEDGYTRVVVDDLRLAREVTFLGGLGFACVLITRSPDLITTLSAVSDRHDHETERELDGIAFEFTIANSGSFDDLYRRIDDVLGSLGVSPDGR